MTTYRLDVFEPREGKTAPALRHCRTFDAQNDEAAIERAKGFYDGVAAEARLDGFILYNGERVVYEQPRKTR